MHLEFTDKVRTILAAGDVDSNFESAVVSIEKKMNKVMLTGPDGIHVPATVTYSDGETALNIGDIVTVQAPTGVVIKRVFPSKPARAKTTAAGTPDRSMKSQGM